METIPSFMRLRSTPSSYDGDVFDNFRLRYGEVQEIIYPEDERNLSKKFIEYKVLVQQRSNKTAVTRMYDNCVLINSFGSLADRSVFTLRADKSAEQKEVKAGLGSKVLLLCVNGETKNAVIIGGMRDDQDNSEEKKKASELGHHFYTVFNGMSFFIDQEGQFVITYNGKTDNDGSRNNDVKEEQTGTTAKFASNGNLQFADKEEKNSVLIDHENGKIIIARDNAFELGEATDKMLLGESFRDAQKSMHDEIKSQLQALQNLLTVAGSQLNTAGTDATLVGLASSAAAGLVASGAAITGASQVIEQLRQTIDTFEQKGAAKNSFLSRKNSSD